MAIRALTAAVLLAAPPVDAAGLAFENISDFLPLEHIYDGDWEHFVGGGVAIFDCNDDGFPDFYAAGGKNPAQLFVNTTKEPGQRPTFEGARSALQLKGVTGAYPLDIDNDGTLDLVILRVGANVLLKGGADCTFKDVTAEWGFRSGARWSTAFSGTWETGREWPTLAIGNYVDRADPDGPFEACDVNELHRPHSHRYQDPVILDPGFCALSVLFSDWARTGKTMLRLSNDRHYYVRGGHEEMWSLDPIRSLDDSDGWEKVSLWGMGIASRDISGDGRPDVMLTSMGDQLLQFLEDGPALRNAPFSLGTYAQRPFIGDDGRPSTGWHAEFADVNNDGRDDLFIAKGNVDQMPGNATKDPNNMLIQQSDGTFIEQAHLLGLATTERSRGAGLVDLNRDGALDLIVVNRRAPLEIHQNTSVGTGNWVALDLRQHAPNTRAVGAWIEVRTGERIQTREITVGGGHGSGQSVPHHFGLGGQTEAELRVTWPDGTQSGWHTLEANHDYRVTPGAENTLAIDR